MAKLSRKKRQEQKRKQQNKLISQGFRKKEVESLSNDSLNKLVNSNITQKSYKSVNVALKEIEKTERRRAQQREASRKYRAKKKAENDEKLKVISETLGLPEGKYKKPSAKWLDAYSLEDIKNLKRTDLTDFIPKEKTKLKKPFDFYKVYKVPEGKKLHFAFRALNGEKDIGIELETFNKYSNEDLLSFLKTIKDMPITGSKNVKGNIGKRVGSSGQAGDAIIRLNSQEALKEEYASQYNYDRRSNNFAKLLSKSAKEKGVNFQHSGIDYHWQVVRQADQNGRLRAYTEITPRKLLVIGNAILWNITELDRAGFYNEYYSICCEIIPEMKEILP